MTGARCLVFLVLTGCTGAPEPPALWRMERGVVWCYRTLADADCHAVPVAGAGHRLIAAAPQVRFLPRNDNGRKARDQPD